jgi:hypothetical protein
LFGRQETGCDGLDDAVERALDGVAIIERAEANGRGPEGAQAAASTPFEVMVIRAVGKTGACELSAGSPIGLDGGAESGFHSILL